MTTDELAIAKQLIHECIKEFNLSIAIYVVQYVDDNVVYDNVVETMKVTTACFRKRDGVYCLVRKMMTYNKASHILNENYYFIQNVDPATGQPIGDGNYKLFQSFKEVKKYAIKI